MRMHEITVTHSPENVQESREVRRAVGGKNQTQKPESQTQRPPRQLLRPQRNLCVLCVHVSSPIHLPINPVPQVHHIAKPQTGTRTATENNPLSSGMCVEI